MKVRCYNCGAVASLDALVSTNAAGRAFAAALSVPAPLAPVILKYLGLFRPTNRELSFGRATTLLGEIVPMINGGKLTFDRQTTDAPLAAWAWGIEQVLVARDVGKLSTPLTNHNYLYRIVQSYDHRKHGGGDVMSAWGGASAPMGAVRATIMLNGLKKPVFLGKTKQETFDIVMQAQEPGESADETYERIKDKYV